MKAYLKRKHIMAIRSLAIFMLWYFVLIPQALLAQTMKYRVDSSFIEKPTDFALYEISGVAVDKSDNLYLFHRGEKKWDSKYVKTPEYIKEPAILKYSPGGRLLNTYARNTFLMPHMITVDNNGNIWAVDVWLQQVIKFNKKGKEILRIGQLAQPGNDSLHFDLPADVAVSKDHSFYVADGYGNARIIKFKKNNRWDFSWGKNGTATGEFEVVHSVAIHNNIVFVADRENARLQMFDLKGNFISAWDAKEYTGRLFGIAVGTKGDLYLTGIKGTFVLSPQLQILHSWKYSGHDIAVDSKGVIYVVGRSGLYRLSPTTKYNL